MPDAALDEALRSQSWRHCGRASREIAGNATTRGQPVNETVLSPARPQERIEATVKEDTRQPRLPLMCCNRLRPRRTEPLPSSGASVASQVWQSDERGQTPSGPPPETISTPPPEPAGKHHATLEPQPRGGSPRADVPYMRRPSGRMVPDRAGASCVFALRRRAAVSSPPWPEPPQSSWSCC